MFCITFLGGDVYSTFLGKQCKFFCFSLGTTFLEFTEDMKEKENPSFIKPEVASICKKEYQEVKVFPSSGNIFNQ